jgi:hypothetical protein
MSQRFTIDGSDALESQLAENCKRVLNGVCAVIPAAKLDGILLGGGYGRGEGGVLKTLAGDKPYNDLEFYVFLRGNAILAEKRFRRPLQALGETLSSEAGLEVEFKVLTLDKLRRSPPSMFYYDLVSGHRWQLGEDKMLAGCEHHRDAAKIPLHEAARLLMNRCSGLLYSAERLARANFGEAEADFVGRNLAKAQLAFGDVLLTAQTQYHWSCRERNARLAGLAAVDDLPLAALFRHHATGVEFKLHPVRSNEPRDVLALRLTELSTLGRQLWLWLESRRLNTRFVSARDYALSSVDKCPETSSLRNRLVNLRAFGAGGLTSTRYPRERLLHALTLLLWEPEALAQPGMRAKIQSELRTPTSDLPSVTSAYEQHWRRFN